MGHYCDIYSNGELVDYTLSFKESEVMPGVKWGNYCQLYTPAFWKYLYEKNAFNIQATCRSIGDSLQEEVVACLLGGYGISSEIGWMAFQRIKNEGLIFEGVSYEALLNTLKTPFCLKGKNPIHYRFPSQKSKFIFKFLNNKEVARIGQFKDADLRNWLLKIDGIGPKTASWITRNWLKSEQVAILDIHVIRAGQLMGLFHPTDHVNIHYFSMENKYLSFCHALDVLPSIMDEIMWSFMKRTNTLALRTLKYNQEIPMVEGQL